MFNDPIVEEVRKVRQERFERRGCDLENSWSFTENPKRTWRPLGDIPSGPPTHEAARKNA